MCVKIDNGIGQAVSRGADFSGNFPRAFGRFVTDSACKLTKYSPIQNVKLLIVKKSYLLLRDLVIFHPEITHYRNNRQPPLV